MSNLEESLRGEHKRRDELDREVKRLEYELQYGAAATTSSQAVGNDEKLHARIKVLETELHRKDSELAQTRAAVEVSWSSMLIELTTGQQGSPRPRERLLSPRFSWRSP